MKTINENSSCNAVLEFFGYTKSKPNQNGAVNVFDKTGKEVLNRAQCYQVWEYLHNKYKF